MEIQVTSKDKLPTSFKIVLLIAAAAIFIAVWQTCENRRLKADKTETAKQDSLKAKTSQIKEIDAKQTDLDSDLKTDLSDHGKKAHKIQKSLPHPDEKIYVSDTTYEAMVKELKSPE